MSQNVVRHRFCLGRFLSIAMFATLPVSSAVAQTGSVPRLPAPAAVTASAAVVAPPDYIIGADDVLAVVFWKEPDISSGRVRVRPDGKISLPLLGDVSAAGLTPDRLKQELETLAKPFFADVSAAVMVNEINSRKVFIVGQIVQSGGFRLNGPMTVLQAVALAGGFNEAADKDRIEIIGSASTQRPRRRLSYKAIVRGKTPDVALSPGDTVVVW
ncbi:MAG TPA: polysaccharide biosynthesis/export family protein [Vicinamibacterales bacterium]|nr:polysaccharide biosynthesis/export family protein [Vicinamibacterales bacterium]